MKFKRFKRITAVLLTLIIMLYAVPINFVYAASSDFGETITLVHISDDLKYVSGWNRTVVKMKANDKVVYCVQPEKGAPPEGMYSSGKLKQLPEDGYLGKKSKAAYNKALYYCYGGTWFNRKEPAWGNKSMKDLMDSYTNINPPSEKYYIMTHILLSYMYSGDTASNGYAWNNYVPQAYINAAKELYNKLLDATPAPVQLRLYYLETGNENQIVLLQKPMEKLKIVKQSSNSSVGYSNLSAEFTVYTDQACNKKFGTITTNADGVGVYNNWADVPFQSYYAKETKAPNGFQASSTVYEFSPTYDVKDGVAVYQITVPNTPYIKLQLIKSSSNPDLTKDNECYSLEGARYYIYTDKACTKHYQYSGANAYIETDADGYGTLGNAAVAKNTDVNDKGTAAYGKNAGGHILLPSGTTFYAKEDPNHTPKGYDADSTVYTFKNSGSKTDLGIIIYRAYDDNGNQPTDEPINDPVGIVLQKKNAITGEITSQGLGGAIFEVQYYAQEIDNDYDVDTSKSEIAPQLDSANLKRTWYVITNDKGRTRLGDEYLVDNDTYQSGDLYYDNNIVTVPIGTTVITEVKEPDGYTKSPVVFYRRITADGAKKAQATGTPLEIPIDEQPAKGYIGIHKMNNSRQGVAGAVYGLYSDAGATSLVSRLTTDANGRGVFNLAVEVNKTYYIKEITAPAGYALDSTVYPITATNENSTKETAVIQDIYEDSIKGDIVIEKSSNDGIVENLWFALSDNLGNEYNAVATDSTGKAKYTGLPVYDASGAKIEYTVKELGFKTVPGTKSYGGYTWTVKAENCISYKGAYYEGVANIAFTNCTYAYSRYYYGDKATAIQNAAGYTKTLVDNSSVTYSFVNTIPTTDIEVNKKSFDGEVSDIWFSVVDQTGKKYGEIKTDSNGYASYNSQYSNKKLYSCVAVPNSAIRLPIKYRVEELGYRYTTTGGVFQYALPDVYKENVITKYKLPSIYSGNSIAFDVYNEADTGKIIINKSSYDGDVSGVYFKIAAYDDGTEYGYECLDTDIGFDSSGNPIHEFILCTDENGTASSDSLVFYDANGKQMNGLPAYILGYNDFEITYEITELGFKNNDGTYTLPARYVKNEPIRFNLIDNRTFTYNCYNAHSSPGSLQISKTSEDGEVKGIWFNVKSDQGYDENFITDENGFTPVISDLPIYAPSTQADDVLIEYTVTELGLKNSDGTFSIPPKYNTPKSKTVTLNTAGEVTMVSINNLLKRGSVTLTKTTGSGVSLSGAEFKLYTADGEAVKTVQTGKNTFQQYDNGAENTLTAISGSLTVSKLPVGDYYFIETKSPTGYMPYTEKIPFTINADDTTLSASVSVKDNKIFTFNTGGNGPYIFYVLGISGLTLTIGFTLCRKIKTIKTIKKKEVK